MAGSQAYHTYTDYLIILKIDMQIFASPRALTCIPIILGKSWRGDWGRLIWEGCLIFDIIYGLGVRCLFEGGRLFKEISLQIMLLFVYTTTRKRFVIFACRYFKLSWNTTAQSQSNCRNFSCSSIILLIYSWWWQWNNFVL